MNLGCPKNPYISNVEDVKRENLGVNLGLNLGFKVFKGENEATTFTIAFIK